MASVVVNGDTSGAVTLTAPAVAGTVTVTLPSTSGVMAVGGGTITTLTTTSDITVQGVTVGRGAGAVSTNTAVGLSAISGSNTGANNTAVGWEALKVNTSGAQNVAVGRSALAANTTGASNNSIGVGALSVNTTGSNNTAVGGDALVANTTASNNTAVGYQAGYTNTTGTNNTFLGYVAGRQGNGTYNTFIGDTAGYNTSGTLNALIGQGAGYLITSGSKNTVLGSFSGNQGGLDIRTASNYIVLSDGDGNPRGYWDSNATFNINYSAAGMAFFNNTRATNGDTVLTMGLGANTNNTTSYYLVCSQPGVGNRYLIYGNGTYATISDERFKKNIETTRNGYLEDICKLRVVKYNWKTDDDSAKKELGLIAQEVEQVFAGLVDSTETNKMIKYGVLVPMLLKAIQELKAEVDSLKAQINGASA